MEFRKKKIFLAAFLVNSDGSKKVFENYAKKSAFVEKKSNQLEQTPDSRSICSLSNSRFPPQPAAIVLRGARAKILPNSK